jgi:hypothetical protein
MSKETDEMGGVEFMTRANVALAGMGRATAALVPAMQRMGEVAERIDYLHRAQIAYFNLQWLSGETEEEIREHLGHYPGSIFDLLAFYERYGCFPCDVSKWGKSLVRMYHAGLQWSNLDYLFWDKSPRLVQGVLLLVVIIIMLLEAF